LLAAGTALRLTQPGGQPSLQRWLGPRALLLDRLLSVATLW